MASEPATAAKKTGDQGKAGLPQGWTKAFTLDEAVVEVLPRDTKVLSAEAWGKSAWTTTARVSTIQPNGKPKNYFLKVRIFSLLAPGDESHSFGQCALGDHGRTMMLGEFTSVTEIEKVMPGLLPAPYAWGKFKAEDLLTYFYLSEFVDMDVVNAPEPSLFTAKVAQLHKTSVSPEGKFGFHVTTCDGKMAHTVDWEDSWATFYAKLLCGVAKLDLEANGSFPKLKAATANIVDKVIPRLLGVLQSEGHLFSMETYGRAMWQRT
ncbi:MAG: hypothetical protein M1816_001272 [Peltula sp. TS41687]|nr:MAG: hypothetical protein M1816_001272 [Peltula sp. TS41687]